MTAMDDIKELSKKIRQIREKGGRLPPIDLRPLFYPVRNQNPFRSSTAFASADLQGYYLRLFEKKCKPRKEHISSPSFLWHNSRYTVCAAHPKEGVQVKDKNEEGVWETEESKGKYSFVGLLSQSGACQENLWEYDTSTTRARELTDDEKSKVPYDDSYVHYDNHNCIAPDDKAGKDAGTKRLFKAHDTLKQDDENIWMAALFSGNPLIIVVADRFPPEFDRLKGDGFFDTIVNDKGSHAMLIVGYLHNMHGKEVFIVRNSYGRKWQDKGYCYYTVDALKSSLAYGPAILETNSEIPVLPSMPKNPYEAPEPEPSPKPTPPIPVEAEAPPAPAPAPEPEPIPLTTPKAPKTAPPGEEVPIPAATFGEFRFIWWLFNDKAEFKLAQDELRAPGSLDGTHIPDTRGSHEYLRKCGASEAPARSKKDADPNIETVNDIIARPENKGKVIGLGACRIVEAPAGIDPAHLPDGYWRWDGKAITGTPDLEMYVMPAKNAKKHPPNRGGLKVQHLVTDTRMHPLDTGGTSGKNTPEINFLVKKTVSHPETNFKVQLQLFRKREDNPNTYPEPENDIQVDHIKQDWNLRVRQGRKGEIKHVSVDEKVDVKIAAGKDSELLMLPFIDCSKKAKPGEYYYLLVRLFSQKEGVDIELDHNWIEFVVTAPKPPST
jgi:hypothetical protein